MITRRAALIGLFCAPAIIRPGVLMPIKPVALVIDPRVIEMLSAPNSIWTLLYGNGDLVKGRIMLARR